MRLAASVMLITLTALAAGCGKKPGPDSGPGGGPRGDGSDHERLQGVWGVEKFEAGEPERVPTPEELKTFRFHFDGDKLTVTADGQFKTSFVLDTASNPKVMIVTRLDDEGRPRKRFGSDEVDRSEWIYKFDGDTLVLALTGGSGKRPGDFTPRPSSGRPPVVTGTPGKEPKTVKDDNYVPATDVLRLTKTSEAPPRPKPRPPFKGTAPSRK